MQLVTRGKSLELVLSLLSPTYEMFPDTLLHPKFEGKANKNLKFCIYPGVITLSLRETFSQKQHSGFMTEVLSPKDLKR